MTLKELKKALPELNEIQLTKLMREIDEVVRVARIEELRKLNWANLTWRDDMADFILYSTDMHDLVKDRIKELQASNSNGGRE